MSISQKNYIPDLLQEIWMFGCKHALAPVEPGLKPKILCDKTPTDMLGY